MLTLPEPASSHLVRVLRYRAGTDVTLFNGEGGEFRASLLNENPNAAKLKISEFIDADRESPLRIKLIQGVSRGDHMDTTIQKATELGVAEIFPALCERSLSIKKARAEKKHARWQQIAASACEQSGRNRLPVLHEATAFDDAISDVNAGTKMLMDPTATARIGNLEPDEPSVCILCGPEGGLSEREVNAAAARGYNRISFGPRVLRTETAGPALIAAIQTLWGDTG